MKTPEEEPVDNCDKNNPKDPHYADRESGDYNSSCVWIWDIGLTEVKVGK